jgi:tryptophan synthase alpha chain
VSSGTTTAVGPLETALRTARSDGRKLLLPYLTAGYCPGPEPWTRLVEAVAAAGADAMEIGIPFSDPVMDGPTIQVSSAAALADGVTPASILDDLENLDVPVPLIAMTYYNIPFRMGLTRYAANLKRAGIDAAILPDLPLEESAPWTAEADAASVETVMLAPPTASDERLAAICARSRGFVYGVGLVGITGERDQLAASATRIASRLKAITDLPVAIGVGVSTPDQAAEVAEVADGVVVGSAVIRQLIDHGFDACVDFVGSLRDGLDRG